MGKLSTEVGKKGEELAAQALRTKGYSIVAKNWRCAEGELDIIAKEDDVWVFVEVKTRRDDALYSPEEAVKPVKQNRLLNSAQLYLAEHEINDPLWRIDVVAITMAESGRIKSLSVYKDAVRVDG